MAIDNDEKLVSSAIEDAMEKEETKDSMKSKPVLPQEFRDVIEEIGGFDAELVMEKPLSRADTSSRPPSRLMMRFREATKRKFLKDIDLRTDLFSGIPVLFIDPSLNVRVMSFYYCYEKTSISAIIKSDPSYILIDSWDAVVKKNKLKIGDLVQLWAFKKIEADDVVDEPKLGFALVRIA